MSKQLSIKELKAINADIKKQLSWINYAVSTKNWDSLDELANQLSATALNFHSENRASND
jgi:hypothetical protein